MHLIIIVITVVLLALYHRQIYTILKEWMHTINYEPQSSHSPPISIIIACRNEEHNLPFLLDALCGQKNQGRYEVILVDDASTDQTLAIAKKYESRYPDLIRVLHSSNNVGKKQSLDIGITAATYSHLLFTDADCIPHPEWCHTMGSHFLETASIFTCGPVMYTPQNGALSQFQYLDGLNSMALIAAGLESGKFSNANGGNMMYTKDLYQEVNGFTNNKEYASGDDVFMAIQAMERDPSKVHFCKSQKAMVLTESESSLSDFLQQRKRWASKTLGYATHGLKVIQSKVALLSIWILALAIAGVWDSIYIFIALSIWSVKVCIDTIYLSKVAIFTKEALSWTGILTTSLLYPFYICYMSFMALFPTSYTWKGTRRN